jgi:hypothetical protein
LIARLAADCATLRRLPAPWQRTVLWLIFVLPCVATVTAVHLAGQNMMELALAIMAWGPGRLSIDHALCRLPGLRADEAASA